MCAHSSTLQEWGCVGVSEPCSSVLNPSSLLFWADGCIAPASEHVRYDNPPPLVGCCSMCRSTFIKLLQQWLPFLFNISQLIVRWSPLALRCCHATDGRLSSLFSCTAVTVCACLYPCKACWGNALVLVLITCRSPCALLCGVVGAGRSMLGLVTPLRGWEWAWTRGP